VSVDVKNPAGELSFTIPRFGVWSIKDKQKPNVIETSDNLDMLLGKYKLTETDVIKMFNKEQEVSEGVVGHNRKTHDKQSLKNLLYARIESLTKGLFSDNDWRHVRKVFDLFNELGLDWHLTDAYYGNAKHDKTFPPTRKQWNFEILFPTEGGRQDMLNGYLTAAGAGSVDDPLDRYDITVVIN